LKVKSVSLYGKEEHWPLCPNFICVKSSDFFLDDFIYGYFLVSQELTFRKKKNTMSNLIVSLLGLDLLQCLLNA
jgi:hypothetical protein